MSQVADFNTHPSSQPATLIANWVEERALHEHTGIARKDGNERFADTGSRTIYHRDGDEDGTRWQTMSSAHRGMRTDITSPVAVVGSAAAPQLPRRQEDKEAKALRIASEIYRQQELERLQKVEAEMKIAQYGHRAPINRKTIIDTPATRSLASSGASALAAPTITVHASNPHLASGSTAVRGANPFARSSHFSRPIDEEHEVAQR